MLALIHFFRSGIVAAGIVWSVSGPAKEAPGIAWQEWSDKIFERARAEHRFVLLDLGAGWCHWCHVMDEITYADPTVVSLIREKYLAVRVDQDARPDLANRYDDYGWPATIVFNTDGTEIVKRRGYLPPKPMASLLQAIIDDPTPGPSVQPEAALESAPEGALSNEQRSAMRAALVGAYDGQHAGWGDVHKYLNWDALEFCLTEGAGGDTAFEKMARDTLTAGLRLIDPVWGGVYQYSTDGDWEHPHFEKIMPFQAENLRVFALAATLRREPQWLEPAQKIRAFLKNFLTAPDGAFFTSQDADAIPGEHAGEYFKLDDAGRHTQGIPRIDWHIYARENGLAITGLAALYAASGDTSCLDDARRAAEWIVAHHALPGGGFRHDEKDAAGPYLADSLAMARAFLALYSVTAERPWLARAEETVGFIDRTFRAPIGFATAATTPAAAFAPKPQVDENIALVRFANLLGRQTGKDAWQAMTRHGMRYLASPTLVESLGYGTSGVLLADRELRTEPLHLTIVGEKDRPAARALFAAALRGAPAYARLEWLEPREAASSDVKYPQLPEPAAFICSGSSCSLPQRTPEALTQTLTRLGHSKQ